MTIKKAIEILEIHQRWRKGSEIPMREPYEITEAIDTLIKWVKCEQIFIRGEKLSLLGKYTKFLQKNGYIDTDATCEEPFAIDEFMKTLDK